MNLKKASLIGLLALVSGCSDIKRDIEELNPFNWNAKKIEPHRINYLSPCNIEKNTRRENSFSGYIDENYVLSYQSYPFSYSDLNKSNVLLVFNDDKKSTTYIDNLGDDLIVDRIIESDDKRIINSTEQISEERQKEFEYFLGKITEGN